MTELGYKTESLQSRFALQKLLAAATGRPEQHAVHFAVLRSLQRAIYSPQEEGHYALASECYCHFTSPIRRYPDLTVHRLVDAILTQDQAAQRLRRTGRPRPALLRPRAAGRGRRTRPDQAQTAGLPQRPHRRGDGRRGDRRGELRALRRKGVKLPAEGLVRVETLARRLLPLRPRLAHAGRPSRRQQLPPRRLVARGRRAGRPGTPRVGFPRGGTGEEGERRYPRRPSRPRRHQPRAPRRHGTHRGDERAADAVAKMRKRRFQRQADVKGSLAQPSDSQSVVVPITTLQPEPFDLLRDIPVVVQPTDDGYLATFFDANISMTGDTQEEAVANLRMLLVDVFEELQKEEAQLGPHPARQLAVLHSFMKRRP